MSLGYARFAVAALAVAGLFVAGCGAQRGRTVVKHGRGDAPRLVDAYADGIYALYDSTDATPKATYRLSEGDELGFREENGQLTFVAGNNTGPVETGPVSRTLYWKYQGAQP